MAVWTDDGRETVLQFGPREDIFVSGEVEQMSSFVSNANTRFSVGLFACRVATFQLGLTSHCIVSE